MIVVVEGPSAAGKTTWCTQHAPLWLPEPGRWSIEEILQYQVGRWRQAVAADDRGDTIVLDGDPFKLYFDWALWRAGASSEAEWKAAVAAARRSVAAGDLGLADLILYSDPGVDELRRRKESDRTRSRRNFARNTAMRQSFREWYQCVGLLDADRVIWEHPADGLDEGHLQVGRRPDRSTVATVDALLESLPRVPVPAGRGTDERWR
jgi:hypothetical protein